MHNSQGEGSHQFILPEDTDLSKHVTETGETSKYTPTFVFTPGVSVKLILFSRGVEGEHLLDQVLLDFSGQIPFLNISLHYEKLVEQSWQAYLADQRRNNLNVNDTDDVIVSESEAEQEVESLSGVTDFLQPAAREALEKRVKVVGLKPRRDAVK